MADWRISHRNTQHSASAELDAWPDFDPVELTKPVHCFKKTIMAEKEGFEPPEACTSTVFKTAAFDHSATSPVRDVYVAHAKHASPAARSQPVGKVAQF